MEIHDSNQVQRQRQAKVLRSFRKVHRWTGAALFAFFFIIAITGLLLGWKKHSNGWLLAPSYKGASSEMQGWLPVDSLYRIAGEILRTQVSQEISTELDRIDIRPEKGMAKFIFKDHFHGVQLDLTTGALLHLEQRRADFIEKIHDGSLADFYLGISGGWIKLFYTTLMGIALLVFTITGFWLWYGPKRMRR